MSILGLSPVAQMSHEPVSAGEDIRSDRDDAALVARVRAGDEGALAAIFHAYATRLCAFAYRYVESRDVAADLVQDVFLKVWQNRGRWEIAESVRAYLYRATRNRALDFLKHESVERRWAEQAARDRLVDDALTSAPSAAEGTRDLADELVRVLDQLPERCRQVFLLRWHHDLSYAEISELMGTTPKTVENQMSRALRLLRERLRGGDADGASS
jgi:RNA polymerase sigma-70 factor (ECF subfamily)